MADMEHQAQQNILRRLKRIEGQVRGIQRMLQEDVDCEDILHQVSAVKSAMNHTGILIFENYAEKCMARACSDIQNLEELQKITGMMRRLIR